MLKIIFSVIVYTCLTVFIVLLIIDIVILSQKLKKVLNMRNFSDTTEVEAEVKAAAYRNMSKSKDKEFLLMLSYSVNGTDYSKELSLYYHPNSIANISVGSKVTLLCDKSDPNSAVLKDNKEESTLKMLRNYDIAYICCALIVALVVFFVGGLNFGLMA